MQPAASLCVLFVIITVASLITVGCVAIIALGSTGVLTPSKPSPAATTGAPRVRCSSPAHRRSFRRPPPSAPANGAPTEDPPRPRESIRCVYILRDGSLQCETSPCTVPQNSDRNSESHCSWPSLLSGRFDCGLPHHRGLRRPGL